MKDILFNEHVSGNEPSPKCRWKRVKIHFLGLVPSSEKGVEILPCLGAEIWGPQFE